MKNLAFTVLVATLLAACSTTQTRSVASKDATYSVVDAKGSHIANDQLMHMPSSPQQTESNAIELQKQRVSALAHSQTDSPLVLLHSELPIYPLDALAQHIEGVVEIRFTVDEAGRAGDFRVIASPDPRLSAACISALNTWRFKAPKKDGLPSTVEVVQQFPFRMR
jgi:TonB family protein